MSIKVAYLVSLVVLIHGVVLLVVLPGFSNGARIKGAVFISDSDTGPSHDHHDHVFSSSILRVVVHRGGGSPPPAPKRNPPKIFKSPPPAPLRPPLPPPSPPLASAPSPS
ncbi:hypothetical protein TorRG33x02_302470 [Trema orientale]|uniref:Transmembrane protein n=1 Tax=Trema orientale TaxID=63057 RepID=A0A2P5C0F2_TREOI|nr:hypothetical protein TorRG33x02_302470 [Trema orientale]